MDPAEYPVHGYGRPVRLTYPVGNAFAENAERRRQSELTAYQRQMALGRQEAAEHHHAAHHRDATHAQPDHHSIADSPRAHARPVSSWSFVRDNNNHHKNNYQGTLEISHEPERLLTFEPLPQTLSEFFPPEDRYLADIPEDQLDSAPPDYSFLHPVLAEISQDLEMSKRDREVALLADMSPGSERERNRRAVDRNHEQVQGMLRRLGYNPDIDVGTANNQQAINSGDRQVQGALPGGHNPDIQQALAETGDMFHAPNMSPQSKKSRGTNQQAIDSGDQQLQGVLPGGYNPDIQQALAHTDDLFHAPNTSPQSKKTRGTNRNTSTPLRYNDNSAEFLPRSSPSRYIYRSQPASAGDDHLLVDRDMNDIHPVVRKRVGPKLPRVPRYDKETDTFDPPQPDDMFIPPQRVDSLVRPDSAASEAMMPRRTPPARFAALTAQMTVPMPSNLVRTYPVKKAAKNDAMVMSSGPLIPTRDGNYAAIGAPRTVEGRPINSMMAQVDCSSPVTAVPTILSPAAAVFSPSASGFAPFSDQNTMDMLIKRVDRLQMKAEADSKVIGELREEVGGLRKEVEGMKGAKEAKEVEREIGDGWYPRN